MLKSVHGLRSCLLTPGAGGGLMPAANPTHGGVQGSQVWRSAGLPRAGAPPVQDLQE